MELVSVTGDVARVKTRAGTARRAFRLPRRVVTMFPPMQGFESWQEGRGFSHKTIKRRRVAIGAFARFISPMPLTEATHEHVEEWLATLGALRTRHAYRSDLNCYYRWAVKRRLTTDNPVAQTDGIRLPKLLPRPVPPEDVVCLIAAAGYEPWLVKALALAAYAGLRCFEIANLTTADISFVSMPPMLTVRGGKGGKDRRVPMHPTLVLLLSERCASGRIIGRSADTIGRRAAQHIRSCGVDATIHQLRHTFGTELARAADGNILLVASLMGHDQPATTMGYIGWSGGQGYDAVVTMYRNAS